MKLYPHQDKFIGNIRAALKLHRKVLMVAPTGFGKSTLISEMFKGIFAKGKIAWFVIHRVELREQVEKILKAADIPYGLVIAGNEYDPSKNIQICMVQTLKNRIGLMKQPNLVFFDEAHISCSATYLNILKLLPHAYIIGGTATARRTDRRPLREIYDTMVVSEDTRWLIDNGYLSKYKIFRPPLPKTDKIKVRGDDYDKVELARALDGTSITGDSLQHYQDHARDKKFIIFDYSVKASREGAELFTAAGFPCRHVDADTPKKERKEILDSFRRGELMGLSNYSLFCEGVDIPDIECVILKRPTKSIIVYRQSIGRGLRKTNDDKTLIILDHANASKEHGLPDDYVEWTLDGSTKKLQPKITPTRTCSGCYAVLPIATQICPDCGFVFETKEREVNFVDGALVEVDIEQMRIDEARRHRHLDIAQAKSYKDFIEIGKKCGYEKGWAYHAWTSKRDKIRKPNTGGNPFIV